MNKWTHAALLFIILVVAALLRFTGIDWDDYNHYHPDERYIAWVATSIEWPESITSAFQPRDSSFNPYYWPADAQTEGVQLEQDKPRRFAYGHFPLYLDVAVTKAIEKIGPVIAEIFPDNWLFSQDILNLGGHNEFRHLTAVGRVITALVDLASVGLIYLLGRWLFGPAAGLLASAFLALNVMHIQLAHFLTVDPYLTFFGLLSISLMTLVTRRKHDGRGLWLPIILAGVAVGLAIGSKFGGVLLLLPLILTVVVDWKLPAARRAILIIFALLIVFLSFALTNPFSILDASCVLDDPIRIGPLAIPDRLAGSCYLQNVAQQGAMVRGTRDVPFVRQYSGTIPYLYFIEMQVKWGMGVLLGLVGFAGLGWATWRGIVFLRRLWQRRKDGHLDSLIEVDRTTNMARYPVTVAEIIILFWAVSFFLSTGALDVKFMRYLQPLTPFLMLYGAAMLLSLKNKLLRRLSVVFVLISTGLYAFSFINIYRQPHPWLEASRWIYQNAPEGATIVSEMWDDQLPDSIPEGPGKGSPQAYNLNDVNWLSGTGELDNQDKLAENLAILANADYLVLASNRNYGVIPRLPERYSLSSQYYPLLFDGRLGFEVVFVNQRFPNLFGLYLKPDSFNWPGLVPPNAVESYLRKFPGINWGRYDESFTVYDQPLVIILQNTGMLSEKRMADLFEG